MFFRFDTQEISYFVLNLEILYLFLYFLKIEKKINHTLSSENVRQTFLVFQVRTFSPFR